MKKRLTILMFLLLLGNSYSYAQCAMCRAVLENNLSNGDIGIGAGINIGVLYLFVAPYLAVALIYFFWRKAAKSNARNYSDGN